MIRTYTPMSGLNIEMRDKTIAFLDKYVKDGPCYFKGRRVHQEIPGVSASQAGRVLMMLSESANHDFVVKPWGITRHGILYRVYRKEERP